MLYVNLDSLKEEGHKLLDEYKDLAGMNNFRAYAVLRVKMKDRPCHFGQMRDKQTILLACGHLKKMIASIKYKKEHGLEI